MASSGNFNTNKYSTQYNGTIGLNLSWSITSQNIANNTSTIHWVLKSNGSMSSGYYVKGGPITVTIGGVTVLNITSRINVNGNGGFTRNGNITITHDENGDKSVSMSVKAALYSASVNCTGSKTYALAHIDRYAIIVSATDFTDEGNPTVVYSNPASEITGDINVRLKWLDIDGVTERSTIWYYLSYISNEGGSYTFDLANYRDSLRNACANSNTLPVTVELKSTMNGVEYYDTKVVTMTIVNADPVVFDVLYSDENNYVAFITGNQEIIVQGQSTLRIYTLSAAVARKGATIVSYMLNFNGVDTDITANRRLDIVKPPYSGNYTATITATDSRGNKGSKSVTVPITPWSQPTAQSTLARVNGFETDTILTVDGTISVVQGNSMSISERHRIVNGAWSSPSSVADNTPTTLSLDNTKEWEVEVTVSDSFTSNPNISSTPTVYTLTVGKGIPIMFIDTEMSSVGINGFPDDDDQLYVGGNIKVTGDIQCAQIIASNLSLSEDSVTFTKSSGSWAFNNGGYTKWGSVVQVRLAFHGGSSNVSVGSNAIVGTVNGIPLPPYTVRLSGYYASTALMGELTPTGGFNVRILGDALNLNSSNTATLTGVYIITS